MNYERTFIEIKKQYDEMAKQYKEMLAYLEVIEENVRSILKIKKVK